MEFFLATTNYVIIISGETLIFSLLTDAHIAVYLNSAYSLLQSLTALK